MQDLRKALLNISRPDNSLEFELHANTTYLIERKIYHTCGIFIIPMEVMIGIVSIL